MGTESILKNFHFVYLVVIGVLVFMVSFQREASTEAKEKIERLEVQIDTLRESLENKKDRKELIRRKREKVVISRYDDVEPDARMDSIRELLKR